MKQRIRLRRILLSSSLLLGGTGVAAAQGLAPSGALLPPTGYGSTNHYFGRAASLYTDWALVGAIGLSGTDGEAHVFEDVAGRWVTRALLAPPASAQGATTFGAAVALGPGLAAVGAPGQGLGGTAGSVSLFTSPDGSSWTLSQLLVSPPGGTSVTGAVDDRFGTSLALVGDLLAVGAPGLGSVEVFRRVAGVWSHAQTLCPSASAVGFGEALAFDGQLLAVGAPGSATVHLYEDDGQALAEGGLLRPWLALRGANFGASVAVQAGDVLVGAPEDDDTLGSAYLFERSSDGWEPAWAFTDPWFGVETYFGTSLGLTPDSVVIGAPGDEDWVMGAVYVYRRRLGGWYRSAAVIPPPLGPGTFGAYVAVYRDRVLTSIGIDDTLPFGFYGGAIIVWSLAESRGGGALGGRAGAPAATAR